MILRFFIVGLGSMGKRRIRNLQFHGEKNIVGFDIRPERNKEAEEKYGIRTVNSLEKISSDEYDVMIISTSPEVHGDYIRLATANKKHFFIEHPINTDGYKEIFEDKNTTIKVPSCTLRFYAPIKMMKKILDGKKMGKILAFQYHMGQYLPDWHPWEDYRQVYFSKKETGSCREMLPFELIWLNWLMDSEPVEIKGTMAKISDLDMDADDISVSTVKYKNKILGGITIDVIARKPFRTLRVLGSEGVLNWERFDHEIKIYNAGTKTTEIIPVPKGNMEKGYVNEEEMYQDEIKVFLDAIRDGIPYPYSFREVEKNLGLMQKLLNTPQ